MSTSLSLGADIPPQFNTMIENVVCLCWCEFVHSGNKKSRKMNRPPREGLGRASAGMWTQPFKAQIPGRRRPQQVPVLMSLSLPCWRSSWYSFSTRRWSIWGQEARHRGLLGFPGDEDQLTAPAFKELSDWETESRLPTRLVVMCTQQPKGVKSEVKYAPCEYQERTVQSKLPEFPMLLAFNYIYSPSRQHALSRETDKYRQCKKSAIFVIKEYFVKREATSEFPKNLCCLSPFPIGGEK